MYPRNAASPEPIAIGAVVQISDGAVQTSGCTVRIKPIGVSEGDGGGTTAYSTDGVVLYTPTQAETNYTSFVLIAKKTGCIPASVTIVTTASATAGKVVLSGETHTSAVIPTVTTVTNQLTAAQIATGVWQDTTSGDFTVSSSIGKSLYTSGVAPGGAGGIFIAGTNAATTVTTSFTTTFTGSLTGSVGSVTGNVGGNVSGSVGSVAGDVAGNVVGSVASVTNGVTLGNTAHGGAASTLTLKSIAVTNNSGNAVALSSTGGNGHGLYVTANGTGDGVHFIGGATGNGLQAQGGSTSGDGIHTSGGGAGDGFDASGTGGGVDIRGGITGNLTGNVNGNLSGSVGSVTADATLAASQPNYAPATATDVTNAVSAIETYGQAHWTTATGFSTLDAAGVRSAVGLATANLDTQFGLVATAASLATAKTELDAVKVVTDKLGSTLIIVSGSTYRFTTSALLNAPSGSGGGDTIVVAPIVATVPTETVTSSGSTQVFQYCAFPVGPIVVVDADGDAIDLSTSDVKMICVKRTDAATTFTLTNATDDGLTIGGADNNEVSVDYVSTVAGVYEWNLFRKASGETTWKKIGFGFWNIVEGPDPR